MAAVTPPSDDDAVTEPRDKPPRFAYDVLLCPDFESVLAGEGQASTPESVVEAALDHGRLLVQARGGAGKTTTLLRLAGAARSAGVRVVETWAVEWANTALDREGVVSAPALISALVAASSPPTIAGSFGDSTPSLMLVDGLNELQSVYAHEILAVADTLASRYPRLGVVVADRLARRAVDRSAWQLATLTPVPEWQIEQLVGQSYNPRHAAFLGNPFFLERARFNPMSAATYRSFFTSQLGVEDEVLTRLAAAVNAAYHRSADRLIELPWLTEQVGDETISQLVQAGVLATDEGHARFVHHLYSDFLAAFDLADAPARWNRLEFDALTFKASSFDAVAMLLELSEQPDHEEADLLVRRVYDWNFYAAAYLLAEDELGPRRISPDMKTALMAMLAERRFDRLASTAIQVSDALRLQRSSLAEQFLRAADVEAVIDIVAAQPGDADWFAEWRDLFVRRPQTVGDASDVRLLRTPDSLVGWTAANILKRLVLTPDAVAEGTALLHADNPTVRWRAAHMLGAVPSPDVIEILMDTARAAGEDLWVRYGAIRSLIEIAAVADSTSRQQIFNGLAQMAGDINDTPQLSKEIARGLIIDSPPDGWAEDAGLLLERLWAEADSVKQQDAWRGVSAALRLEAVGA